MANAGFFETVTADRLMDARYFSPAVFEFLRQERLLLDAIAGQCTVMVEVGCHDGRYLAWAVERGMAYLGVDVAARHLLAGRARAKEMGLDGGRYRFVLGDARDLVALERQGTLPTQAERALLLFPFGLFGALDGVDGVIEGLAQLGQPFVISMYQTNAETTNARRDYYGRCGIHELASIDDEGVRISSSRGFESVAYDPHRLLARFRSKGLRAVTIAWSAMNLALVSRGLEGAIPRTCGAQLLDR